MASSSPARPTTSGSGMVFVTIGTTKFDALIEAVDSPKLAQALISRGYDSLVIQAGASEGYRPHKLLGSAEMRKGTFTTAAGGGQLQVEWFEYSPSLATFLESASLVISHAGAGSIFETLRLNKPLITVPNPLLMDNHQVELADKLAAMGHLASATTENLVQVVEKLNTSIFVPYVPGDGLGIVAKIDQLCGVAKRR